MTIGVPRESVSGETRVALVPGVVGPLTRDGFSVLIESGAGLSSSHADDEFVRAGAKIVSRQDVFAESSVLLKVQSPGTEEVAACRKGATYIGFLSPFQNAAAVRALSEKGMTAFAMEFIPRITRAQSMDALSSMATIAGYRAVLLAAEKLGKMFPLMMTAAGTVPPANVFVLGAGVAGLQAIATAKRLGGKVEAFDPRPAVRDQIRSLGAAFVEMEMPADVETAGGYAKELSPEFVKKEMEAIAAHLPKTHVLICTAQVFGKRAPLLVTEEMVDLMHPGSVIVDLAAEQGGNCAVTKAGTTVVTPKGVSVIGALNLPASVPMDASQLYAKNVVTLLRHLYPKPGASPDFQDEIVAGACILKEGAIVNEQVAKALS